MERDPRPRLAIRKAKAEDLVAIERLYENARAFMRVMGNPQQWGTTYPPKEKIEEDLALDRLYVGAAKDQPPVLVFSFYVGHEAEYEQVYGGAWSHKEPYGVLHRVAAESGHGAGKKMLDWAKGQMDHLRIDTHGDNLPMQHLLLREGFRRVGIIHLASGDERIAFEFINNLYFTPRTHVECDKLNGLN